MNKVFLIGRLTRDPEVRYTPTNTPVCQISVAVRRQTPQQGSEQQADFINVIVWNKQAETIKTYLSKGSQVAVEGRIQTRNYEKEGKKIYVTEVIASNVEFLSSSNNRASNNAPSYNDNPFDFAEPTEEPTSNTTSVDNDPFASFGDRVEISDGELPF